MLEKYCFVWSLTLHLDEGTPVCTACFTLLRQGLLKQTAAAPGCFFLCVFCHCSLDAYACVRVLVPPFYMIRGFSSFPLCVRRQKTLAFCEAVGVNKVRPIFVTRGCSVGIHVFKGECKGILTTAVLASIAPRSAWLTRPSPLSLSPSLTRSSSHCPSLSPIFVDLAVFLSISPPPPPPFAAA